MLSTKHSTQIQEKVGLWVSLEHDRQSLFYSFLGLAYRLCGTCFLHLSSSVGYTETALHVLCTLQVLPWFLMSECCISLVQPAQESRRNGHNRADSLVKTSARPADMTDRLSAFSEKFRLLAEIRPQTTSLTILTSFRHRNWPLSTCLAAQLSYKIWYSAHFAASF